MQTASPSPHSLEDRTDPRGRLGLDHTLLDLIVRAGRDPGLTPLNKAVFLAVVAHAINDGVCSATDQALARDSHTSIPTVQRTLKLFEGQRVFRRSYRPKDVREIRLLTGEHFLVVDVDELKRSQDQKEQQQQQQNAPAQCSPVISRNTGSTTGTSDDADEEFDRLVALLTAWKVVPKVARELVRDFPERIVLQVEAHRHRNVSNPAGALVVAIREDWPTDLPERRQTAKEAQEEVRRTREKERQVALDVQAAQNALMRAEEEKVRLYWDSFSHEQQDVFDEEAIQASSDRDLIRSLRPGDPLYRVHWATARWEHVRRKLGLEIGE